MIQNIILLLVTNTLIPYLPFSPALLTPLPLVQTFIEPPSILENMNLSRIYSPDQFKNAFRTSLKIHHPDHGGSQEVFQQIQGLKKIMREEINYYDLYNLTDADISLTSMKLHEAVQIKKYAYYVETGIFYFITFLYILAFTLDSDIKTPRMIMLGLTICFALYELYMHQFPISTTVIDLFYSKIPLFTQRKFMKRALIIWIAIIHTYFERKQTEQRLLLNELRKQKGEQQYRDILERLCKINKKKLQQKEKYQKSFFFKLRNWISKGISIIFLFLIIKNFIPGLNML